MKFTSALFSAAIFALATPALAANAPTDPQIAHIAYTAGQIDIDAGKQALDEVQEQGRARLRRGDGRATTRR